MKNTLPSNLRISSLLALSFLCGCNHFQMLPYITSDNPYSGDAASVARGEKLYVDLCSDCHGAAGRGKPDADYEGETPPADLTEIVREKSPSVILAHIAVGKGEGMPGFSDEADKNQLWDIVNYIETFKDSPKN